MATPSMSANKLAKGIVLRGEDELITGRAKSVGLPVVVSDAYEIPFEKTLFVEAGTRVPWDLLPAAWHFLARWDAAVPLWAYGTLARDVGTAEERKATKEVIGDLRVMLHAVELLFVRNSEQGRALVEALAGEGGDKRLAFLRALFAVKPRLCVLPVTWLAEVRQASQQAMYGQARPVNAGKPLVRLELEPGRIVKVHAGDEEKVVEMFRRQQAGGRHGARR